MNTDEQVAQAIKKMSEKSGLLMSFASEFAQAIKKAGMQFMNSLVDNTKKSYWFVSYHFMIDKNARGFGQCHVECFGRYFPFSRVKEKLKEENNATSIVILNFTEVSREQYDLVSEAGE